MADQVPAVVDNAAVIQALDGQAPQADQPVQVPQDDALANQVQAVGPVQPGEPAAEMSRRPRIWRPAIPCTQLLPEVWIQG